jgi:high affinity sulfate transporter 1
VSGVSGPEAKKRFSFPIMQGILPIDRSRITADIIAGTTLAALGIPEVMGYTKIAGMPVITGLYTILLPIAVFALLGSSRHLVVGADSATAAIMAAGLAGMAAIASPQYVQLAGILALITAAFLLLARLVKLGFLADFLSRSVLIGFLTGVGVQVAMGQVAGMLGVASGSGTAQIFGHTVTHGSKTVVKFLQAVKEIPHASWTTVAVSVSVLAVILILKRVNEKIPGALIAVVGAIVVSWAANLASHGVAILGPVPGGLPKLGFPTQGWSNWGSLTATAASLFLVILAQSAATSRAYAAKYAESFDENIDLVGLSLANVAAAGSGTFVVNGSPTKTQMVDSAGGRSEISQLSTAVIVAIVLLFLTKPLQYMPEAVLASIVFLIGVELIDIKGMRRILDWRPSEFVVAVVTAVIVVVLGVEQGIVVAIVLSLLDHVRRSYRPSDVFVTRTETGVHTVPVGHGPAPELVEGLVVYRFSADLYYATANRFLEEVRAVLDRDGGAPEWLCLDLEGVDDIDFSAGDALNGLVGEAKEKGSRVVVVGASDIVAQQLGRYGIRERIGEEDMFRSISGVEESFRDRGSKDTPHP